MVISLRGTSGAGKSWVMHQILSRFPNTYDSSLMGHIINDNTFLIGPYLEKYNVGCDTIGKSFKLDGIQSMALQTLQKSKGLLGDIGSNRPRFTHILFEGLIVSSIYGRWVKVARQCDFRWVFLNTPLDVCLANVNKRREERREDKELNPENTIAKHDTVRKQVEKARRDEMQVWNVSSNEAVELIAQWIQKS